jgi:hypothetical protein
MTNAFLKPTCCAKLIIKTTGLRGTIGSGIPHKFIQDTHKNRKLINIVAQFYTC